MSLRAVAAVLLASCTFYRSELLDDVEQPTAPIRPTCHPEESARDWVESELGDRECQWDSKSNSYICNNGPVQLTFYGIGDGLVHAKRWLFGDFSHELACGCGTCELLWPKPNVDGGVM